ncbi:MAG: hypothetical protein R3199_09405 [Gemmatimonadota bacterium]|nr:hypothetical protein [Gemmatimonadota bacterium]
MDLHLNRKVLTGGVVAGLLSLLTLWLVGRIGGYEARILLESSLPTIRFLCSTTAAAAATVIALMLTLLSLSESHETSFRAAHYGRIQGIALLSTITLVVSILVLLLLVVPIQESEKIPARAYEVLYYVILGTAALLGGLIVAIMLMLYEAIVGLVQWAHPETDSHLIVDEEDEEEDVEEEPSGGGR